MCTSKTNLYNSVSKDTKLPTIGDTVIDYSESIYLHTDAGTRPLNYSIFNLPDNFEIRFAYTEGAGYLCKNMNTEYGEDERVNFKSLDIVLGISADENTPFQELVYIHTSNILNPEFNDYTRNYSTHFMWDIVENGEKEFIIRDWKDILIYSLDTFLKQNSEEHNFLWEVLEKDTHKFYIELGNIILSTYRER